MADAWEEIRRLAADFQRAQFAEAAQRLSERNCIEIVNKLISQNQLDVVHTLDGKEYITPAQISKEMREELHVRGGRVNIVDLQQVINVDLTHIENRISDIIKSEKHVQIVLGQLIDENYLDRLSEEVNDKLQESGQVTISELCKTYDLPGDFLTQALTQRLGRIINGHIDLDNRGVIFTEAFVARHKARIRGLFSAITRSLSAEDAAMLLQQVMRPFSKQASALVFSNTVVVSEKFISDCTELFSQRMHQKAEKEMKNNPVHLITEEDLKQVSILESVNTNKKDKKDERRKKATEGSGSVRGGGGGKAREYKIKKIKKKGRKDDDSDDESQSSHADDTQTALTKHLLKTVCTDITNLMFNFLASDLMMAVEDPAAITSDIRKKILSKLTEETKVALTKLHNSLNDKDQHALLVKYQGLVVQQLVNQNKKSGQKEDLSADELDKEQHDVTNATRKELQELSLSIKDLVLKSRKSSVTEE
ncbi:E3 UFM1-protein ligase 1 [Microtus ochrogaster]|uniref:E3 UFM1-protein ligase 1 n=1 Tax=Microtus ochrogaster TaxID=79684 RepID=A0A8J6H388_MICOH|nr:E3 UFM1-protein ligase 1 [Microtus ochrogaster]